MILSVGGVGAVSGVRNLSDAIKSTYSVFFGNNVDFGA